MKNYKRFEAVERLINDWYEKKPIDSWHDPTIASYTPNESDKKQAIARSRVEKIKERLRLQKEIHGEL